ncbi:hypothetical protein [Actinoallomurus acanthiterrae]
MGTVMNLLLIRFALIVGAVVLLVIVGFTVLVILKRAGCRRPAGPPSRCCGRSRRGAGAAVRPVPHGGGAAARGGRRPAPS